MWSTGSCYKSRKKKTQQIQTLDTNRLQIILVPLHFFCFRPIGHGSCHSIGFYPRGIPGRFHKRNEVPFLIVDFSFRNVGRAAAVLHGGVLLETAVECLRHGRGFSRVHLSVPLGDAYLPYLWQTTLSSRHSGAEVKGAFPRSRSFHQGNTNIPVELQFLFLCVLTPSNVGHYSRQRNPHRFARTAVFLYPSNVKRGALMHCSTHVLVLPPYNSVFFCEHIYPY